MLNNKADELLEDEVSQSEIMDYIDRKYGSYQLVTQRTIQRWLNSLGIDCIQPRPKRNRDIRYKKSDVLMLEKVKRENLIRKRNLEITKKEKEKLVNEMYEKEIEYNEWISNLSEDDKRQQDIDNQFDYKEIIHSKIREDKLEMCFKKLFPNVEFDIEKLEKIMFTIYEPSMHTETEYSEALMDMNEKAYIKMHRD